MGWGARSGFQKLGQVAPGCPQLNSLPSPRRGKVCVDVLGMRDPASGGCLKWNSADWRGGVALATQLIWPKLAQFRKNARLERLFLQHAMLDPD